MTVNAQPNNIYLGDALHLLDLLDDESVDLVLTDPPYFLDKLDENWDPQEVKRQTQSQAIKNLPAGMRFDPEQGKNLEKWYRQVCTKLFRVLKPGAFFFSFSSPRLVHRMAVAVEDAGFHIRDMFIWLYPTGRPKAFSLERFAPKERRKELGGWKTPQVRGNYEPIIVAQKPPRGNLVNNFLDQGVGLFNFEERLSGGYSPSNVLQTEPIENVPPIFLVNKPSKEEKGPAKEHPTVKPVALLRFLIRLSTKEGALVLDPFIGSGSTALAAIQENRRFIGFEINQAYYDIAKQRLQSEVNRNGLAGTKGSKDSSTEEELDKQKLVIPLFPS